MAENHTVTAVRYSGEKDNPHGGKLHKFYVSLRDANDQEVHNVYWQRKAQELTIGQEFFGHIENGEYGPRFKTDQRPDGSGNQGSSGGGNFTRHFERVPDNSDRSRRIERQHSQEMAIRVWALHVTSGGMADTEQGVDWRASIKDLTDHFQQDLDADVGGGKSEVVGSRPTSSEPATADVSADLKPVDVALEPAHIADAKVEASPAQKRKLTTLMRKAGLADEAIKAVVLYRCRSEEATKDGASQLITDLLEGATHDQLIAEVHDAARAGDAVAIRARKLIPSATPADTEGLPELDEDEKAKLEDVPF